jgi:hypothetical protein
LGQQQFPDTTACLSTCACRPAHGRCRPGCQPRSALRTSELPEHEAHDALGMSTRQFDANASVTWSRLGDATTVIDGAAGGAPMSARETTNAASGVTASGRSASPSGFESFLRHRPNVLTPCSRQKRRAPSPLHFHAITISRQNASSCRSRRAPFCTTVSPVAWFIALLRPLRWQHLRTARARIQHGMR